MHKKGFFYKQERLYPMRPNDAAKKPRNNQERIPDHKTFFLFYQVF